MSSTLSAEAVRSTNDRASGGRFAKNNPGGPGNPFARRGGYWCAVNKPRFRDLRGCQA